MLPDSKHLLKSSAPPFDTLPWRLDGDKTETICEGVTVEIGKEHRSALMIPEEAELVRCVSSILMTLMFSP